MRALIALGIAVGIIATIAAAGWPQHVRPPVRAIDGDTLDLAGQRVRLWGIDAAERGQGCLDHRGHDMARVAALRLATLIRSSSTLDCTEPAPAGPARSYDRAVRTCRLSDGTDLGGELVAEGLVWVDRRFAGARYDREAAYALAAGTSSWQAWCLPPWQWRTAR